MVVVAAAAADGADGCATAAADGARAGAARAGRAADADAVGPDVRLPTEADQRCRAPTR